MHETPILAAMQTTIRHQSGKRYWVVVFRHYSSADEGDAGLVYAVRLGGPLGQQIDADSSPPAVAWAGHGLLTGYIAGKNGTIAAVEKTLF